ncbi:MAG: hypothetical protein WD942_07920 [Dehalococcoidia bacterium]
MPFDYQASLRPYIGSVRESIASGRQLQKAVREGRLPLRAFDLPRRSDTLFILGSGPSINEMTADHHSVLRRHHSVGFNFWAVHPFVPDIYVLQATPNPRYDSLMADIFRVRAEDYGSTRFIVRGSSFNRGHFFKSAVWETCRDFPHMFFSSEYYVSSQVGFRPSSICRALSATGLWRVSRRTSQLPKFGSTVSYIIFLGASLGFTKIVLCGIDMMDSGHFYDKYHDRKLSYPVPPPAPSAGHPHMAAHRLTVKDGIVDIMKYFDRFGISIYTATQNTVLYPEIPLYQWPS